MTLGEPLRQHAVLAAVVASVTGAAWLDGLVLVGSLAAGAGDAVSDVDLLVVVREGAYDEAWAHRGVLRATGQLVAWDQRPDLSRELGAHKWLTPDLVLVEALLATTSSGLRLAQPWRAVAGDPAAAERLTPRPSVDRAEMSAAENLHPAEAAYDDFKRRVRAAVS